MGTSGGGQGSGGSGGAGRGGGGSRGGTSSGSGGSGPGRSRGEHGSRGGKGGSRGGSGSSGGYSDYASSDSGSEGRSSGASQGKSNRKSTPRNVAQVVLGNLKPAYLEAQFAGPMLTAVVHELALFKIDIVLNKSWKSACSRLGLPANASPAEVRDEILRRHGGGETDTRIRDSATATTHYFFEELCKFDDDLLYGKGNNQTLDALEANVVNKPLESFLRLHYINVLQREQHSLLDSKSQIGLEKLGTSMAGELTRRLRVRYGSKDQSSEGDFLQRAGSNDEERAWLLTAIRQ